VELNPLEEVSALNNNIKYRIKFTKTGNMIFIGHLDLLKFFQRTIKRAGLPIAYSQGFNPHQLITFAIPLSLGVSSIGEYVDMQFKTEMDCDEIVSRLNDTMPLGIKILSARKLNEGEKTCAAAVEIGTYKITLSEMYDNLNNAVDEIIKSAIDAHKAGAAVIHIHARDKEGKPTTDIGIFKYILSSIKKECDAVIGITTGGANGMSVEERFSVIDIFKPEMASANAGSMNFCYNRLLQNVEKIQYSWEKDYVERTWDNVFRNSFKDMEYCIKTMNSNGTLPEFEVFDYGQLNNLKILKKQNIIQQPIYIQFVPGVQGGMPANIETLMFMIDQAKKILGNDIQYSTVGVGRKMFKLETASALNGGNVRVGMEDGLYINPQGDLAIDNAQQVVKIKEILSLLDYKIANSEEARKMLLLKGKENAMFTIMQE